MDFDEILGPSTGPIKDTPDLKKKKNYVLIALDESGSMSIMKKEAIEFFNSQVIEARNAGDEMDNRICLIVFNSKVREIHWDEDANEVELLDESTYRPGEWTAMLDAVGFGIDKLSGMPDIKDPDVSVLFIVISDGQENSSREYNYGSIAKMVKKMNKTNRWTFVYLGANQDLSKIKEMGIHEGNIQAFDGFGAGMQVASNMTLNATRAYLTNRSCTGPQGGTGMTGCAGSVGYTHTSNFFDASLINPDATSNKKNRKRKTTK